MKKLTTAVVSLLTLLLTQAVQAQTATHKLTITVSNLLERKGTIRLGLVTKAENFMGKSEIDTAVAVPAEGPLVITLTIPAGTYAARLHQDLNGNGQMDMANGRPEEPFGFSNIPMLMGPPSFDAAAFALTADTDMKIVLISM